MGVHVGGLYGAEPTVTNTIAPTAADTTTPANGAAIWVGNLANGQIMQVYSRLTQMRDEGQTWGFPQPSEYNWTEILNITAGKGGVLRRNGTSIADLTEASVVVLWRDGFPYVGASLNLTTHLTKCMNRYLEFAKANRIA